MTLLVNKSSSNATKLFFLSSILESSIWLLYAPALEIKVKEEVHKNYTPYFDFLKSNVIDVMVTSNIFLGSTCLLE